MVGWLSTQIQIHTNPEICLGPSHLRPGFLVREKTERSNLAKLVGM